jgi:photosystem II stability/assembly factor-like uncharacterized protein
MIFSKLILLSILTVVYACSQESQVLNTTLNVADLPAQKMEVEAPVNVIYQSSDAGTSWQDMSKGLSPNIQAPEFYADEKDLYVLGVKDIFHGTPNVTGIAWEKENFMGYHHNFVKIKGELISYTSDGEIRKKSIETNEWKPIFKNFGEKNVRVIFESSNGTVLIGCDHGLFKTADDGKTWKLVHDEGWVIKIAESNGVLIATGENGIMRSTDGGENWNWVIQEGGAGIDVEPIQNGFVAITYNGTSETRRIRASFDQGATWQLIDNGLPPSELISSIVQLGENFFCGHLNGIYKSTDKGQTWKLLLPSVEDKIFDLSISGNTLYAVPKFAGC